MLGLLAPTCVALLAALALGGSIRVLLNARVQWWLAVLAAFGIELVLYNPPVNRQEWALTCGPWLWLATRSVLLAAVLRNAALCGWRLRWGWCIAAGGLALNSLVIVLNGGYMPQSNEAATVVWGRVHYEPGRLYNVAPIGPGTRLGWLGDVLPEPVWLPRPNVISPGDVLLAMGVGYCVFFSCLPSATQRRTLAMTLSRARTDGPARPARRCERAPTSIDRC